MKLIYSFLIVAFTLSSFNATSQCNFTISNTNICGLQSVDFNVISPSGNYTWDFDGDGNIDATGPNASYSFPQVNSNTIFAVTLFRNNNFCSDQNVTVLTTPDATIGVLPGSGILDGDQIRICSSLPDVTLDIYNASMTYSDNVSYTFDWGDGTTEVFDNSTFPGTNFISHDYAGFGYYYITLTVETSNGCIATQNYTFYNGGNPSVGLATPGNTTGLCAPATVDFPITNTSNNPDGTTYNVYVSGVLVQTYTQNNVPAAFSYTFLESSCGLTTSTGNYENAYDIQIEATNPCGSSQATIEPIEVSTPPELEILITEPTVACEGEEYTFTNESGGLGEVSSGNPSTCTSLPPTWSITPGIPGVDWEVTSGNFFGSDEIIVVFYTPGDYTITMNLNSPSCGSGVVSQSFTVFGDPVSSAIVNLVTAASPGADECVSTMATFQNESSGDSLNYVWNISPAGGWNFIDTSTFTTEDIIVNFTEPGNYNVSLLTSNECDVSIWDTTLVIVAAPEVILNPINDYCETATLNFDASDINYNANNGTFTSIEWSFPGGFPSTYSGAYPSGILYNSTGNYTVSVTATNQCGQSTSTQTFNVQEPGNVSIMPDQTICRNDASFYVTATPAGGSWSGNGVSPNGFFNPGNNNVGNNILTYDYLDGNCSLTATMVVTVLDLTPTDAGPDQEACVYETLLELTGASPVGGTWSTDNGAVIIGNTYVDPVGSGPGVYNLFYSFTDGNNCTNTSTKIVIIHDRPDVDAGLDQSICENPFDISLTGFSPLGGTWTGTGVTSMGVFNAGNTPGLGNYTLTYNYVDSYTGCANSDTKVISIVPNDVADAGMDEEYCINDNSFSIQTGTPAGGTWSGNGIVLGSNIFNPALAGAGIHVVTYTFGVGVCETSDTKVIEVLNLPNLTLPNLDIVCINEALVDLSSASPVGGAWSGTGVSGNYFAPNIAGVGVHTLTYFYTDMNTLCSNSASMDIEVLPLPTIVVNDTSYCNTSGLVDLPIANPSGGTWSGVGVSGNQFDPNIAGGIGDFTLTYAYTDGNGCENNTTITASVISPNNVNAGSDFEICIDAGVIDLSQMASPQGGNWNSNGSAGLNGNSFNPFTAGIGTHTLTYFIGGGNCQVTDEVQITINALPIVTTMDDFEVCESEKSIILSASPYGGTWTSNNGGVLAVNIFDATTSGAGNFSFTYTYQGNNGCVNYDNLLVSVNPLPTLMTNDTTYCNTSGLVPLPYSTPTGGTWSGTGINNNQFDPQLAGGVGSHNLTYTYTNGNGCSDEIVSTVSVTSSQTIDAGPDMEICMDYGIINLDNISSPGGGTWIANGSAGLVGNTFDPTLAGDGTHTLTYTVGNDNCQVWDDIVIIINELPYVDAGQDQEVCFGETNINLVGFPAGGTWTGTGIINAQNGTFYTSNTSGDYTLTYSFTNSDGCINSDEVIVTIKPLPIVDAGADFTLCNQPSNIVLGPATPAGGNWSGDGIVDGANGVFNPLNSSGVGSYDIIYTYTNPTTDCTNSDTITVTIVDPEVIDAGPNDTLCIDQGIHQLNNFQPTNGTWSGTGIIDATAGTFDPVAAGEGLHTLTYSFGTGSCFVEDTKTILVIDLSYVTAGPDESTCITYEYFALSGYSPAGGIWTGNGIIDSGNGIFDPMLAQGGDHVLTYTYTDDLSGCIISDAKLMTVFPMENPTFDMPHLVCRNEVVNFENLSPSNYTASWTFGDGNTSTDFSPSYAYDVVGSYVVTLEVENEHGCVGEISDTIVVTDVPVAYFQPDTSEACVGLELNLTNLSFGVDLSYNWTFGDSQNSSTLANPGVIYFENGINDTAYVITLTTTNQCGSSTFQDVVTVHPQPVASIGLSPQTDCSPVIMEFANISVGAATDFYWDYGNENTSTGVLPETQTYIADTTIEVYTVTLVSSNVCGSDTATTEIIVTPPDVQALAGASQFAGCQPLTVDFYNYATPGATIDWIFGDGNSSSQVQPSHTFTEPGEYTIIQFAGSDCGYDTTSIKIVVYPAPEVEFTHPNFACSNQPIQFSNNSINTSGNYWDFGDGQTSQINQPEHIFTEPGEYTVTLQGISIYNQCPATYTSVVTVMELPDASFEPAAYSGCVPFEIELYNSSQGTIFYEWNFGDGNTSIEESPKHIYNEIGTYEVTLIATDINGCFNDTTLSNIIVHPKAEAAFEFERTSLCGLPAQINFENQSSGATGYTWNFGNGLTTPNTNPSNVYTEAGDYFVELIATNQFSCADTVLQDLTIYPEPEANFEVEDQEGCEPMEVTFRNTSTASNNFYWDFGNGNISEEENPIELYQENGLYDVQLIVSIDDACFDTLVLNELINVHITPFANFEIDESNSGVNDGVLQMINLSENADNYYWEFSDGGISQAVNPSHRFFNNGNKQIYLEASTEFGCTDDTLINIIPKTIKGLFVPNAFSPEQGLGGVRIFKPAGVGLKEYHMQIFSPYGQLLWETQELADGQPTEYWDGRISGKLMAQDVYVWKAYAVFDDGTIWQGEAKKNGGYKTMGSVTLLR